MHSVEPGFVLDVVCRGYEGKLHRWRAVHWYSSDRQLHRKLVVSNEANPGLAGSMARSVRCRFPALAQPPREFVATLGAMCVFCRAKKSTKSEGEVRWEGEEQGKGRSDHSHVPG